MNPASARMAQQLHILVVSAISSWIAVGLLSGCHTPNVPSSPPTIGADWRLRQGQALWRPAPGRPELAGELLLASHSARGSFVEFAKTPLPLVTAWQTPESWRIAFPGANQDFSGEGSPPGRWIWFQLRPALDGEPLSGHWVIETLADGAWRLENRKTGERLEGFFPP